MKKHYLLLLFWLSSFSTFAQKDTTFRKHLLVKVAPLTYLSYFPAIQLGIETNISTKETFAFDYAYGNYDMAIGKSGNGYIEGESSHRYRLEYRWYKSNFAEEDISRNIFMGIELQNRTNFYPSTAVIGRYCISNSFSSNPTQCSFYEKSSATSVYHYWGLFFKFGVIRHLENYFWLETYGGLGLAIRSNPPPIEADIGINDHIYTKGDASKPLDLFETHRPSTELLFRPDMVFSMKLIYKAF